MELAAQHTGTDAELVADGSVHETEVADCRLGASAEETRFLSVLHDDLQVTDDVSLPVKAAVEGCPDAAIVIRADGHEVLERTHVNIVSQSDALIADASFVHLISEPREVVGTGYLIDTIHQFGFLAEFRQIIDILLELPRHFLRFLLRVGAVVVGIDDGVVEVVLEFVSLCFVAMLTDSFEQLVGQAYHVEVRLLAVVYLAEQLAEGHDDVVLLLHACRIAGTADEFAVSVAQLSREVRSRFVVAFAVWVVVLNMVGDGEHVRQLLLDGLFGLFERAPIEEPCPAEEGVVVPRVGAKRQDAQLQVLAILHVHKDAVEVVPHVEGTDHAVVALGPPSRIFADVQERLGKVVGIVSRLLLAEQRCVLGVHIVLVPVGIDECSVVVRAGLEQTLRLGIAVDAELIDAR